MTHLAIELPFPPFPNLWTPQHLTEHEGFKIWLPKTTGYVGCASAQCQKRALAHARGGSYLDRWTPLSGRMAFVRGFFALTSQDAPHALNLCFLGDASPQFRSAARGPARFLSYQAPAVSLVTRQSDEEREGSGIEIATEHFGDESPRIEYCRSWRNSSPDRDLDVALRQSAPGRES